MQNVKVNIAWQRWNWGNDLSEKIISLQSPYLQLGERKVMKPISAQGDNGKNRKFQTSLNRSNHIENRWNSIKSKCYAVPWESWKTSKQSWGWRRPRSDRSSAQIWSWGHFPTIPQNSIYFHRMMKNPKVNYMDV